MLKEREVEGSTCTGVGVGIAVQSLQFASVEVSYSNRRNAVGERRCAGLQVEDVRC